MLTFLSVLMVIAVIAAKIIIPNINKKIVLPPFIKWLEINFKLVIITAIVLFVLDKSFFIGEESKQYYILNKSTGNRSAVMTPGFHFIMPFVTQVKTWDKYVEIKGVKTDSKGNLLVTDQELEALKSVEGVIKGGVDVRFTDKVTAKVFPSVRFQMPSDEKQFIKIVETYRSQENLVMNTIVPTISEQLKNITFMFTADEYVSGSATIYRSEIEDVLKNGSYVFTKAVIRDTIYSEPTISGDTSLKILNNKREIREIKVIEKNQKVLKDGVAIRKKHEVTDNNIITAQVIIDDIILDPKYENKLKEQMNLAASAVVYSQKVIAAKAEQASIIAVGEKEKAEERVKQEKEQISKLISIETKVKEEESQRQLAIINEQTEIIKARATKVAADAEAYKNSKLVSAGLTPLEKAKIEKETKVEIAKALSSMNVPANMIIGGNSANSTESLLQIKLLKDLLSK